ncbi:MAG: M36 family metallopeptidase, partial [Phycisphaerae bacterium]
MVLTSGLFLNRPAAGGPPEGPPDATAVMERGQLPDDDTRSDLVDLILGYVGRSRTPPGLDADVLRQATRSRDFVTAHNGIRHLTLQQRRDGLDVLGCRLRASVSADGRIVAMNSTLLNEVRRPDQALGFVVTRAQAALLGLQAVGLVERVGGDDIQTRRVYFPMGAAEPRPAWQITAPDGADVFELVLDAGDGTVLKQQNRRQTLAAEPITLRVFQSDSPAPGSPGLPEPTGQQMPFTSSDLLIIQPGDVAAQSPNGWIPDGTNRLSGNNVDAHLDKNANDVPDLPLIDGSPYRVFDFPSSHPDAHPDTYSNASVTQLFHICNVFHDRLHALGFDEAAHNFQFDNFGGPGLGGDGIQADAQDGALANAATFTTGAQDGSAARLQAHLFLGPTVPRDSAFDRDLIVHELAHGLSIRLLESIPTAPQPQALSEGWSDFMALALQAQPGDDPHAPYPFAPYIAYRFWPGYQDNYYFGLRRYPYSTDLSLNPLTYADIDPARLDYPPGVP